jgi:hypothetical protein
MPETNIMIKKYGYTSSVAPLSTLAAALVLTACGGGGGSDSTAVSYSPGEVFKVGTTTYDPALPPEPTLPTDAQVCATLEASPNLVRRPDGSLPPEADPSKPGVGVAADPAVVNPDQARIQAALDACGAAVERKSALQLQRPTPLPSPSNRQPPFRIKILQVFPAKNSPNHNTVAANLRCVWSSTVKAWVTALSPVR